MCLLLDHDRPSQKHLNIHVVPTVTLKWRTVGEVLLDPTIVENKALDIIKENNPQNVTECCKQMFVIWLDTDEDASWKKLIAALQCPGVELNCLAERIKRLLHKGRLLIEYNCQLDNCTSV